MESRQSSLKWDNHKSTFFENLKILREKSDYTDSTLAVEGHFYPVHKLVMSSCSEYFRDIFEVTSCKSPVIVLKDVRKYDIEALLDYIYLGEVNIYHKDLASVLKTAECLRIKGLAFTDESSKIHVNSSSYDDALRDSPPPKRQRQNSSNMPPHAVSAVPYPQDNHPVIKVERDFSEGQKQTVRGEIDYEESASSVHDPSEDYGLEIKETKHEVEIDDAKAQEETSSRKNTYEGDASGDYDTLGECGYDLSKTRHDSEDDDTLASVVGSMITNKLFNSAKAGDVKGVQLALQCGADINWKNPVSNGTTPLWIASHEGHSAIVEMLLNKAADVNMATQGGQTPLWIASFNRHSAVVEMLLNRGADVNMIHPLGWTPLYAASLKGHSAIVKMLLNSGADVNMADNDGRTPLSIASAMGCSAVMEMLKMANAQM